MFSFEDTFGTFNTHPEPQEGVKQKKRPFGKGQEWELADAEVSLHQISDQADKKGEWEEIRKKRRKKGWREDLNKSFC